MRGRGLGVGGHDHDDRRSTTEDQIGHAATNLPCPASLETPSSTDPVNGHLDKARSDGLSTDRQYTIDPDREIWSDERDLIHDSILDDLYARSSDIPCEHKAII